MILRRYDLADPELAGIIDLLALLVHGVLREEGVNVRGKDR